MVLVDNLNATRKAAGRELLEFHEGPYLHTRAFEWDSAYDRFGVAAAFRVRKPNVNLNMSVASPLPQITGTIPANSNVTAGKDRCSFTVLFV